MMYSILFFYVNKSRVCCSKKKTRGRMCVRMIFSNVTMFKSSQAAERHVERTKGAPTSSLSLLQQILLYNCILILLVRYSIDFSMNERICHQSTIYLQFFFSTDLF